MLMFKHTICAWKAKFGGIKASEAQNLRAPEDGSKRLAADLSLDREWTPRLRYKFFK